MHEMMGIAALSDLMNRNRPERRSEECFYREFASPWPALPGWPMVLIRRWIQACRRMRAAAGPPLRTATGGTTATAPIHCRQGLD